MVILINFFINLFILESRSGDSLWQIFINYVHVRRHCQNFFFISHNETGHVNTSSGS